MAKWLKRDQLSPEQLGQANRTIAVNLARPAFTVPCTETVNGKSPWNPSVTATSRVPDGVVVPKLCNCCGSAELQVVHHEQLYGMAYGDWPWALLCRGCGAYVGFHPFTNIPLGTLADAAMREARKGAKAALNRLWRGGNMSRDDAYLWLAQQMGIAKSKCHVGMFDVVQCKLAVELSKQKLRSLYA